MARETFSIEVSPRTYNKLGRMVFCTGGRVLTLEDHRDAARFHIGMDIRAGVAPDQLRRGSYRVIETDESSGAVVVAGHVESACSGDYLFWCAAEQKP